MNNFFDKTPKLHHNEMQQIVCGQIQLFLCDICNTQYYLSGDYRIINGEYYCEKCWKEYDKNIIKQQIKLECLTIGDKTYDFY